MSQNTEPVTTVTEGDSLISFINQVPAIEKNRNSMIMTRDEVAKYVEQPLLPACLDLWDKNVKTLATSANAKDIGTGRAYIIVDYGSMSDHNKQVAQKLGVVFQNDGFPAVSIDLPVTRLTSVRELSDKANEVSRLFKKQKPRWIPSYTLEQLKQIYRIEPDDHQYDAPDNWTELGFFHVADSGKYFLSQEHYEKTLEEIEE